MTNIEKLLNNDNVADKKLAEFIISRKAENLANATAFNRGKMFEVAITKQPFNAGGKGQSKGDYVFKGRVIEIKYLTKKTGASSQQKGTIAEHYLIGFNTGKEIIIKIINKNELKVRAEKTRGKITYQDNINLGYTLKVVA